LGTKHRVCESVSYTETIGPAVNALFERGQVVLSVGVLDVCLKLSHADEQGTAGGEGDPALSELPADKHRP